MNNLECAKNLLHESETHTLALACGEETHVSCERGVRPLMTLLATGKNVTKWSAADRIVGKAAAFLYVLLGVREVYADVISELAVGVLRRHGIGVEAQTVTKRIINHAGDGLCPMESAVEHIEDANEAYEAIKAKIAAMKK